MNIHALIIAGGVGARFWPRSRERSPKQLLKIVGDGTMIQNTVFRLDPIVPKENILIVTNAMQAESVRLQLPQIPAENIIFEPAGRNTAPAIALGAEILRARHGDVPMIVLPADHIVQDVALFQRVLKAAVKTAEEQKGLVTLGITPTHPETGYGYIQFNMERPISNGDSDIHAYPVRTFAEKPNLSTAERFLESGDFVWNSGMFIWKVSTILNSIAEHLPDLADEMFRLRERIDTPGFQHALEVTYREMRGISIDYGVMEKAANRFVIPANFGWNDLGSWDEVYRLLPKDEAGNVFEGHVYAKNTQNCHLSAPEGKVMAAIDINDLTVIDTEDALLLFKRGTSQDVKEVVDYLRKKQYNQFL